MKKIIGFSGLLGAVLIPFGLLGRLILNADLFYILNLHILAGLILTGSWCVFGLKSKERASFWQIFNGKFNLSAACSALFFLMILVCVNYIAARQEGRLDVTVEQVHSLSKESLEIVRTLKKPVRFIALKLPKRVDLRVINSLFKLYRDCSGGKITTRIIDPVLNPYLVDQLNLKKEHAIYIEYGEGKKKQAIRLDSVSEELLTNSLFNLSQERRRIVYYVEGHDQPDLESKAEEGLAKFALSLSGAGYEVKKILLSRYKAVPEDASLVVLAAPQKDLLPQEKELLIKYTEGGGNLLLLHDPDTAQTIPGIAAHFNMKVGGGVIIDPSQRFHGADLWQIMASNYGFHPITKRLSSSDITVFLLSATVQLAAEKKADQQKYTELVKTSEGAWGETDLKMLFSDKPRASFGDDDLKGPLSLAVAFQDQKSKVVVFGDSEWIKNMAIDIYANRELLLNVVRWMAEPKGGISIAPRSLRKSLRPISSRAFLMARLAGLLCLELFVLIGLFICWKRRTVTAHQDDQKE